MSLPERSLCRDLVFACIRQRMRSSGGSARGAVGISAAFGRRPDQGWMGRSTWSSRLWAPGPSMLVPGMGGAHTVEA